ncbi:FAD-dependent oxidoreductase [Sanguibacter sp. HDW7]|uniref:FAD-dependent oxidoreductase n=1 Tax=Sanguibacter sp. HDW7 TaxID=2714931 RepID=UPI00140B9B7E|nr:FAD-dependent oxidoreductase [Sanguibacter sp. HDW7]QIK83166.1 NAD(P)/FAD-dependent oxidoreductase [Sanguibacter sp. HDW7]
MTTLDERSRAAATDHGVHDVVVVGAGQAGLSASYHLQRLGTEHVVLDANPGPGGAWRHRWPSLTFGGAHGIADLPGLPLGTPDPTEPASAVVERYYGTYEQRFDLPVVRPVRVTAVSSDDGPDGPLTVTTDAGSWRARTLVSATGTWDRPHWPYVAGRETFGGRQMHTRDFWTVEDMRDQDVVVVGGGTSAVQLLLGLEGVARTTTWATRRAPGWTPEPFDPAWGLDVERRVRERTLAGLPTLSVVAATGLPLTDTYRRGIERGTLVSRGMFTRMVPDGVVFADDDGTEHVVRADTVVWATGFRHAIDHLAPLRLREPGGGIRTDGTVVDKDPRVLLVGYGASASTLGATRAGRRAALAAHRRVA